MRKFYQIFTVEVAPNGRFQLMDTFGDATYPTVKDVETALVSICENSDTGEVFTVLPMYTLETV